MIKSKHTIISSWMYCHCPLHSFSKKNSTCGITNWLLQVLLSIALSVSLLLLICSQILSWISILVLSFYTLAITTSFQGLTTSSLNNSYSFLVGFFTYIYWKLIKTSPFFPKKSTIITLAVLHVSPSMNFYLVIPITIEKSYLVLLVAQM